MNKGILKRMILPLIGIVYSSGGLFLIYQALAPEARGKKAVREKKVDERKLFLF
jgi:hypothetical protein